MGNRAKLTGLQLETAGDKVTLTKFNLSIETFIYQTNHSASLTNLNAKEIKRK